MFADTTSMPIIRKKIRKLERQGEMESKHKWQMVTRALLADDVEAASAAKHEVRGGRGGRECHLIEGVLSAGGGQTASGSTREEGAGGGVEAKGELSDRVEGGGRFDNELYLPSCMQYFFSEEEGVWHYNHRLHTRLARKEQ